ncbi:hypothetical protein QWZ16_06480 [Vibrio ostreicida]|uniref:Uncharacterized protein n=1 Tax=Vibrio ostreicida TaxID=526588 RepID=A0ABT8BSF6_9VIBR|nr:hypothetical protein [Vibrio ostreicida]MDN3609366.1 hypothetical protein [Vibrio ostreicida]
MELPYVLSRMRRVGCRYLDKNKALCAVATRWQKGGNTFAAPVWR